MTVWKMIAVLMLTGMLEGFAPFGLMPHVSAQVNNQGAMAYGWTVQGQVTQKFVTSGRDGVYYIAVNGTPYDVPLNFYNHVQVGTVVQFNGTAWTIISGGF